MFFGPVLEILISLPSHGQLSTLTICIQYKRYPIVCMEDVIEFSKYLESSQFVRSEGICCIEYYAVNLLYGMELGMFASKVLSLLKCHRYTCTVIMKEVVWGDEHSSVQL